MLLFIFLISVIISYIICDVHYFFKTVLGYLYGRIFQQKVSLTDVTSFYGLCTFRDCDVTFKHMRLARIVRELDFARYQFYDRTGIYQRSLELGIKSLQGCTLTVTFKNIPLFTIYRIDTKLVFWDDCSLFFEHKIMTTSDGVVRMFLVSRQHAIGPQKESTKQLLQDFCGSEQIPECPEYIQSWLKSMAISSEKLRSELN